MRKGDPKGVGMATGVVKWFNADRGYGFITTDDGVTDLFVHFTQVVGASALNEGERVEFEVAPGTRGPQAQQVIRLDHQDEEPEE
jgi:CspA family cold shock protein